MQKARGHILAVVGKALFLGFSIQIVLGMLWMLHNFTGVQQFGESALYVEISKSFICDEYEGILYPVLILLARGMENIFPAPCHCILYLLQLGAAFYAGYRLVRQVSGAGKLFAAWGSLAMLTFPMAMQCHLSVLPESLLGSFLLLELSHAAQTVKEGGALRSSRFARVLAYWLLTALLKPEYFYLGAAPVLLLYGYGAITSWKENRRRILYNTLLAAAFAGMILGVGKLSVTPGYYGRVQKSIEFSLAGRCAWPFLSEDYEYWPAEVKEHLSANEAFRADFYADEMGRIAGATLENTVGEERARELFLEMAQGAWERHKDKILHRTAWDALGYAFSPMVVQRQLTGKVYDSYSGRNYDIMRARSPLLTKYYLNYGCWWFAAGLGLAAVMWLVRAAEFIGRLFHAKKWIALPQGSILIPVFCLLTGGALTAAYTLRGAGMMDYKKTIAIGLLWIWWMLTESAAGLRQNDAEAAKNHGSRSRQGGLRDGSGNRKTS